MGKRVREYKSGDFIFAKVKGYPAWPARVQKLNGKKYYVYFYGTGETANLPPTMIFDYAENKDKFLTKMVKRRDFRDGVKQIEHDFANNVPLEQVIGVPAEEPAEGADDTLNETGANDTMDESAADTTAADTTAVDDTKAEDTTANSTTNDTAVEDSDDTGALVIDEGKQKGKKGKPEPKPKETPAKPPPKEPKTPRGKAKKEEPAKEEEEENKKDEEIVSRSGRKIRPKRYIDEHTEDNATLPSPAPKKRRGASPSTSAEDKKEKEKSAEPKDKAADKNIKQFNAVTQSELEDLKEPFKPEDAEKENILITHLPSGQYVGIKLFQSRPSNFKNESTRLQWDKQAASNAVTLKMQLEKGQITSQSVIGQLVTDLNLTDEEKATLDKERETEEKKSRVQFLKTEMKLIELDAKIKTCLCLEKADTEMCLKLLDDLMELQIKPLMLLKHPTCLETIKRMRAYVGNTPSWELSESAASVFSKQAHNIRRQADTMYKTMKDLFTIPDGLSFWEYFTERVLQFKKATAKLNADELLEMIHEPIEMSAPTAHTMQTAVEAANEDEQQPEETQEEATQNTQKKKTPAKTKKATNSTPSKQTVKRQSSRKLQQEEKDKETNEEAEETPKENQQENSKEPDTSTPTTSKSDTDKPDTDKPDTSKPETSKAETTKPTTSKSTSSKATTSKSTSSKATSKPTTSKADKENIANQDEDKENAVQSTEDTEKTVESTSEEQNENVEMENGEETERVTAQSDKEVEKEKSPPNKEKSPPNKEKSPPNKEKQNDKEKEEKTEGEPRAKRSRETKKTEPPPPRSPAKRKSKF